MTDMTCTVKVDVVINRRRLTHMMAHAHALVRRARKRDRPALADRLAREMARKCARISLA